MAQKHLTVLESPWEDNDDGDLAEYSMRPFVEGLCELNGWKLIYRTFTSGRELGRLLDGEAFDDRASRQIAYIACHGDQGRLVAGVKDQETINLASVADKLSSGVEGVWLGACDVATSKSLDRFLVDRGAVWAGGYCYSVDWATCMQIDIAVLHTLMQGKPLKGKQAVVQALYEAFDRFDPGWVIGENDEGDDVELCETLRVVARDQGGRPADVTQDLKDELGWERVDEE